MRRSSVGFAIWQRIPGEIASSPSESLIAAGEPVREAVKHALTSDDPEVRAQAQSILTALSLKKQVSSTTQDGTLEQKLRRTHSDGSVTTDSSIEVEGQPIEFERPRSPDPLPFPGGGDPFEGIRRAEQQMKRMEEQMFRRFPTARPRNPAGDRSSRSSLGCGSWSGLVFQQSSSDHAQWSGDSGEPQFW